MMAYDTVFTYSSLIGWNPINIIEGEGRWVMHVALASVVASLITTVLYVIKNRLVVPKGATQTCPVWSMVVKAVYMPILVLVWYAMIIYSIDVVSDDLLSDLFSMPYAVSAKVGIVLAISWALTRLKNGIVKLVVNRQIYPNTTVDIQTLNVLSKVATIIIVAFAFILLHDVAGINMTTVLAFGGVGGLAIAFASQDIVANFFGSLMIHIIRPFVVGEDIAVPSSQLDGRVEEIGWYQTRIRSTLDTTTLYVPNSMFSKALVVNKTRIRHRLINETIYVKMDVSSLSSFIQDMRESIKKHKDIAKDQRISVWIISLFGPAAKIGLYAYVQQTEYNAFLHVRDDILIEMARLSIKHGGALVPPPENNEGWLKIASSSFPTKETSLI